MTLAAAASELDLLVARNQMALSLGFHIVLAAFGVGFPLIALIAHWIGLRNEDVDALRLAKRWAKVMAVLFAVGAVSGTILSFEMGMLWPGLMGPFGDVIGLAFSLEGIAFFVEAIFIAIYLYGWRRLPARVHLLTLIPIVVSGIAGTFFVLSANAWMNNPAGFRIVDGQVTDVDPWAAMLNPGIVYQFPHMLLAAYMVSGFGVASVYAVGWMRGRRERIHRLGFLVAFTVGAIAAPVQILVGDFAARAIIEDQPAKFAAMELIRETGTDVPLTLGGVLVDGEVYGAIELPGMASFLATGSIDGTVPGLDVVPVDEQPPANIVHVAFQIMVAVGFGLLGLSAWFGWSWWRHRNPPSSRWFWLAAVLAGPAATVAMETGWIVTEVGRQPWIVYGLVRTQDAVTAAPGLMVGFVSLTVVYVALTVTTVLVLRRMAERYAAGDDDLETPYGPPVETGNGPTMGES